MNNTNLKTQKHYNNTLKKTEEQNNTTNTPSCNCCSKNLCLLDKKHLEKM